jgi:hypothetical protein
MNDARNTIVPSGGSFRKPGGIRGTAVFGPVRPRLNEGNADMIDATVVESTQAGAAYDARWQRYMDCVALRQPDRMPVVLHPRFWLGRYGDMSYRDVMYDYERTMAVAERAILEFRPDLCSPVVSRLILGPTLQVMEFKQVQWPGHGVGDDQPFQYLDREYMTPDEYDDFIFDPTGFYLHKYLPRVAGVFSGVDQIRSLPGLHYFSLARAVHAFARPGVREGLQRLMAAADEIDRMVKYHHVFVARMKALGFPIEYGASTAAPYDFIADYFRGAKSMMKDLFRRPDKLHAMMDKAVAFLVRQAVDDAKASANPVVFIPIHWAGDQFMSQSQFETFWWPSFRRVLGGLIDAGLIPLVLWEASCAKRLETIRDVPPASCIYWFERTDMVHAFEVLGDVVALRGNLASSLLTTGSPEDVDREVKRLVDQVFAKGGRLILDGAFGIPDETPVANVQAMFEAARKYAG